MDLGKCTIKSARTNTLSSALHRSHGLAWTDGKVIYLAPVNIISGEIENSQPIKLGEFSEVISVHWSCDVVSDEDKFCYLCVVHRDTVTLWKVNGSAPNLSFKQVRKINCKPLFQGCMWNPHKDMLCLLTKEKASFYFNHLLNKGSYALPAIESGHIYCGCWSSDGEKLVLGIGAVVLIYQWQDLDKSVSDYSVVAWKIPDVSGNLCCVTPYRDNRIVCTVELPLDQICVNHEQYFEIPDISIFDGHKVEDISSGDSSNLSSVDRHTYINVLSSVNIGRPPELKASNISPADSLFNLQRNSHTPSQECSQLIIFDLSGKCSSSEPVKLTSQNVLGVLSPDLLYCQSSTDTVVIGSNTQNTLHVYCIKDDSIVQTHMLHIEEDERPKGICGALLGRGIHQYSDGILTMVAKRTKSDNAFLPSSSFSKLDVKLKYLALPGQTGRTYVQNPKDLPNTKMFREIQLPNGSNKVHLLRISPLRNQCNNNDKENEQQPKIYPNKMVNVFPNDTPGYSSSISTSHSSAKESKNNSRSESPEFNLVLPNTNEIVLTNDHIKPSKIECLNNSSSSNKSDLDNSLETEKAHFDQKPAKFSNKVKRFFENNNGDCAKSISPPPAQETGIHSYDAGKGLEGEVLCCKPAAGSGIKAMCMTSGRVSDSSSDNSVESSHMGWGLQLQAIESQVQKQKQQIAILQSSVSEINRNIEYIKQTAPPIITAKRQVENSHSTLTTIEVIHLTFKSGRKDEHSKGLIKTFLLDNRRLKLDVVTSAFHLSSLEILIGDTLCVVGGDTDGYIPLQLEPGATLQISGNKAI